LKKTQPDLPEVRFSNGDLWLENFITWDHKLAGVIDFPFAGFSDPIYEFLLSFFISPQLKGRGVEERYCRLMGYDPALLPWYHGFEIFDSLRWVLVTGQDYGPHTAENLVLDLQEWLDEA
jgi:aminoglycoside phosphotransferase (APT) family kinase protein